MKTFRKWIEQEINLAKELKELPSLEEIEKKLLFDFLCDLREIVRFKKTEKDKRWEKITEKKIEYSKEGKQTLINYLKWKFDFKEGEKLTK